MSRKILIISGIYIVVIIVFALLRPQEIDWRPVFTSYQKSPFASRILYEQLSDIFGERLIRTRRPIYNLDHTIDADGRVLYLFITTAFRPADQDLTRLLDFVSAGNVAFIASESLSQRFTDTLGFDLVRHYSANPNISRWYYEDNISLHLKNAPSQEWDAAVRMTYTSVMHKESGSDTLGYMQSDQPNFVRIDFGLGTFFVHTYPYIFSNYHMLKSGNEEYIAHALSEIPQCQRWIWDDYYKGDEVPKASHPFAALSRSQSFRWAYWLGIVALILFIVFTAKRRQRVIPVIAPVRNTTLDFVRTIGDLYFHRSDHKNLIEKKIGLVRSFLFKRYRIRLSDFSNAEADAVAKRTGHPQHLIRSLFGQMDQLQNAQSVGAGDLISLNEKLDRFYQRTE